MSVAPKLSVVVPAYNEERTLATIVKRVLAVPVALEVLVVDDGSTDGTRGIADALQRDDPRVRAFHLERNSGKGAAVRRGIGEASGEYVVIQDGDLEYDPQDFVAMLAEIERTQGLCLYGSRRLRYRSAHAQASYYWGGVVVTWFTNLLYRSRLTDEPTCYKMWRRELVQSLKLECDGFEFCPEVTAKVLRRGIAIPEIQIKYEPRTAKEGKKIKWRDGIIALWTLLKYRFAKG